MAIGEKAIRRLQLRVPDLQRHPAEVGTVFIRAAHPDVGDVEIRDDEGELTVHIGAITHSHFSSYGDEMPEDASADEIAEAVASFLGSLLSDRVVLWSHQGAGGLRVFKDGEPIEFERDVQNYLWSGPIEKPNRP